MKKQDKVLIIQLTRIGDLIQTLQAARQLKAEDPELKLSLVARKRFAEGIIFLLETVFDELYLFDTKDFFIQKSFSSAKQEVHTFLNTLRDKHFDMVINLSFSKSSSYMCSLIHSKYKLGAQRNSKSEVVINDKWSQYVYSNTINHSNSPFNLVDLYRYIMGVQQTLILESTQEKKGYSVVLHPFASQKRKKWGVNKWNELIFKLAKDNPNYHFYVVGGPEDTQEAKRLLNSPALAKIKDRITNLAGKSKISDIYQLLSKSHLFIGHDSMVGHLASETLTPSIIISLGVVRPFETSPYSDKVINLSPRNNCFPCSIDKKCELLPCHSSINYQVISTIAHAILNKQKITKNFLKEKLTPFHLSNLTVYSSQYAEDGLELKELTENFATHSDVFRDFYKIIWLYYLRGTDTNSNVAQITRETAEKLYEYQKGVSYLFEIYNFGVKYSNKIIEVSESKDIDFKILQDTINKVGEIDKLCSITKKSYPLLKSIVDYFYVNKANAIGDNLIEISQSNLLNYYDASNLVAVLGDFIEKSIAPHISTTNLNKEV